MRIKDVPTLWGVLVALGLSQTMGAIVLRVTPYPARIYQLAPPGTPVLTVSSYDNRTGAKMDQMYLSPGVNSSFFQINVTSGVLSVKKRIEWTLGTTLSFFVYAGVGSQLEYKHVMIIVSAKNKYPPAFISTSNEFKQYRYGTGERVGSVTAQDNDSERYNSIFKYKIADERADTYLKVSSVGEITLKHSPPESIQVLTFPITATDEGSPRLTGTTMVKVTLVNVRQPTIFCFATDATSTTLCWKNPMVRRPEVTGFVIEVTGGMDRTLSVQSAETADEMCEVVNGTQMGKQYFFKVSVRTTTSSEINRRTIMINTTGIGFTPQCLHNHFDSCKYLKPCQNGAACRRQEDGALNYQCECTEGWKGKNCTLQDMCASRPCQNRGDCRFDGHQQYTCACVDDYYGLNCQHFNECSLNPCQNNGRCTMNEFGRYTCSCPDHFTGKNCELKDPCQPSPCNQGTCTRLTDVEYSCDCFDGYYGDRCNYIDRCILEQPCKQGGTCQHIGNNTYICNCPFGTTGPQCMDFDPCSRFPCKNEATCVLTDNGAYDCLCHPGFYGGECQHYNTCHTIQCGFGSCKETENGPQCICDRGYYGDKCELYNPCEGENPCELRGQCRNTSNGHYECDCVAERYGLQCQYLNSCRLPDVCLNGGVCENIPSQDVGRFKCECLTGYYGETCANYNPCVTSPCVSAQTRQCRNTSSHEYHCDCSDGYYGKNCEQENPCRESSCSFRGTCNNITSTDFSCLCPPEFVGDRCEVNNPCSITPCLNSGTCTVDPPTYQRKCHCTELFTGQNCETPLHQCDTTTCQNGGTCQADSGQCQCTQHYTGVHCESPVTPCTNSRCDDDKVCRVSGEGYVCVCPYHSDNEDCSEDCPREIKIDKTGRYTWPKTKRGDWRYQACGQPGDDKAVVSRYCARLPKKRARWSPMNSTLCQELGLLAAGQKLDELKTLTSDPSQINADQLANFTNILEEVFPYSVENMEIAESMTSVMSNLADVNASVTVECDRNNDTSRRLVDLLQSYTANTTNTDDIATSNINLKAVDISDDDGDDTVTFEPSFMDGNSSVEGGISISLPPEVMASADTRSSLRLQFIGFKKSMFFLAQNLHTPEDDLKRRVVTAIVKGVEVKNLSEPVVYTMRNIGFGQNHTCYYWNPENKTWLNKGVKTIQRGENTTECHSYHLTSFAILMDTSPGHTLPKIHEQILTYISYIGCAISLIGLVLTIITYGLFRCLNKDKSGKILLNLCVSMMLMNIVFLMGSQSTSSYADKLCTAIAVLLHYFLLATLMWMLVEALEMYQALVTVFAKYARFYMTKRCIGAWGVPLVIVLITLAVDLNNYRPPQDFCFISHASMIAYYVALVAPSCLIIVINTIVFIMVARVILKPRFQQQQREDKEHVTPAQVRGAFTVMILLGVTWVFGPISINEAKIVFNYLFCVLNSLQGFFIFVFRCLFNPEARLAWYQLIKTGTLKTRRGPIKSVYSETSKGDHSKSKSNGHFGGTLKSNIMNSNGWHHPKLNGMPSQDSTTPRRDTQYFAVTHDSGEHVFHTKDDMYLDNNTPPTRTDMLEDGFTHL